MGLSQQVSSFSCEMRIIQAQNIEVKSTGNLLARIYLPAGNNKTVQLNSRKISSKSVPFWNDSFCLDCVCTQEFLETLNQESLVLELRQSHNAPVLGRILGSRLLGRAEIPWKIVLESPNMVFEGWVKMDSVTTNVLEGVAVKPPELQVNIKIGVPSMEETENSRSSRNRGMMKWDECGCREGHEHAHLCSAEDYDIFALAVALETL